MEQEPGRGRERMGAHATCDEEGVEPVEQEAQADQAELAPLGQIKERLSVPRKLTPGR